MTAARTPVFPWPCHRRDAHQPHEVPACTCAMTEASQHHCPKHGDEPGSDTGWCLGLAAHPSTMAGGSWRAW